MPIPVQRSLGNLTRCPLFLGGCNFFKQRDFSGEVTIHCLEQHMLEDWTAPIADDEEDMLGRTLDDVRESLRRWLEVYDKEFWVESTAVDLEGLMAW